MKNTMKLINSQLGFLLLVIFFDLFILTGVLFVSVYKNIPVGTLTRDAGNITGQIFIGMLSNLGIILWAVSAAACFMGTIILYDMPIKRRFLLFSGLVTTLLAVDDAFLLHDGIIPRLFHVHEWPVYVGYLLLYVLYLAFFMKDILSLTHYPFLALALMFFGVSIIMDVFFETFPTAAIEPFFEDGAKFIGISLWCFYFFSTTVKFIQPHMSVRSQQ